MLFLFFVFAQEPQEWVSMIDSFSFGRAGGTMQAITAADLLCGMSPHICCEGAAQHLASKFYRCHQEWMAFRGISGLRSVALLANLLHIARLFRLCLRQSWHSVALARLKPLTSHRSSSPDLSGRALHACGLCEAWA